MTVRVFKRNKIEAVRIHENITDITIEHKKGYTDLDLETPNEYIMDCIGEDEFFKVYKD